ncbi:YcgL domain-containing protein [Pelagibaculum spongiae]|uniref:YcgL domain-containing protein DC094_19070 n=1 Tax=Pelagibaculum spongiae TaxID=2080658 RepID=A0A2V1GTE2_9GAMM|nr:YcgL domain-containing protein [Pelagibaculum spongiae]PVZ64965.1 hypothetical protein DC094_19070 [Pelagibaculum spongiae]
MNQSAVKACAIYRSSKKQEMYLYVEQEDDFSRVPEALLKLFGTPTHVMNLQLTPERKLARVPVEKVIGNLQANGYYLQQPPQGLNPIQIQGGDNLYG